MQLLSVKFAQIATQIEDTNAQITALQAKMSELQEYQQQLLSVEQAMQSALNQVDQALMMANHIDPSQIEIFWDALKAKFAPGAVALIEPASPEHAPEPVSSNTPTEDATEPTIDVQVTPEPEPEVPAPETEFTTAPEVPTEPETVAPQAKIQTATLIDLKALSIQAIRKLASKKGVGGSGTRLEIAGRLAGLVTTDEWRALM